MDITYDMYKVTFSHLHTVQEDWYSLIKGSVTGNEVHNILSAKNGKDADLSVLSGFSDIYLVVAFLLCFRNSHQI